MVTSPAPLDNVAVVLKHPKYAENVGAAARSCFNMAISRLILVRESAPAYEDMAKMATHKAVHLIDTMEIYPTLEEALAPFHFVVGTTARIGRKRTVERAPRDIVKDLLPLVPENRVAFLFGPEDRGLTNDDLKYCQFTSCIPTAAFASLNLAQAVAIHCYELYFAIVTATREEAAAPQYASTYQLEGMYRHVEEALLRIDFLDKKSHNYWMRNIRSFLGRIKLTAKEANIIRGICRQFLWYQNKRQSESSRKTNDP